MIILDTDVLNHFQKRNAFGDRIKDLLSASSDVDVRFASISVFEMFGDAVALIVQIKGDILIPRRQSSSLVDIA